MDTLSQTPQPPAAPNQQPNQPKTNPLRVDARTWETIKASAIWNAVASGISSVFGHISLFFIGGIAGKLLNAFGGIIKEFSPVDFIKDAFWGAVYGALIGFVLSKYFSNIQQLNRTYLRSKLNTFFKLLFYPSVVF